MTLVIKNYNGVSNGDRALTLQSCVLNCACVGSGYKILYSVRDMLGNKIDSGSYECNELPKDISIDTSNPGIYIVDFTMINEQLNAIVRRDAVAVPVDPNITTIPSPNIDSYLYALMTIYDPVSGIVFTERINGSDDISFGDNMLSIAVYEKSNRTGCIVTRDGLIGCGQVVKLRYSIKFSDDLSMKRYLFMKASQWMDRDIFTKFQVEFCQSDLEKYKVLSHYLVMKPCISGFAITDFNIDTDNLEIVIDAIIRIGDWKKFLDHLIGDVSFGCVAGAVVAGLAGGPEASPIGCSVGARVGAAVATLFHFSDIFSAETNMANTMSSATSKMNNSFNKLRSDVNNYVTDEDVKRILLKDIDIVQKSCYNALSVEKQYYEKLLSDAKIKYGAMGVVGGLLLSLLIRR